MQREVVLDTETTGLDPDGGHRVVEVAALELVNHLPTGRTFHSYVNPQRDVPEEAFRVHGLSAEFLRDYPVFAEVVDPLLEFLEDSPLVIHNAAFDVRFLNAELIRHGREPLAPGRATDYAAPGPTPRSRAPPTASTRCAAGSRSTTRRARCTARCSTASSWPRSTCT